MSVSYIPEKTKILLWGKAAGRCQYRGCNACLYRDDLTQAEFNQAYIAHIVADQPTGPRGDEILSEKLKAELSNLMLMCDEHHRLIDKVDIDGHSIDLLQEMKKEHEDRIERITAINKDMHSHIVIYKANIGIYSPILTYESVREYLHPAHFPAMSYAIDLSLINSPFRDKNDSFWKIELENLIMQFNEQIRPKLRKGEIKHLSIFAFAPMPLLIKLGVLINDIQNAEIFQPIRDPKTWSWQNNVEETRYIVLEPETHFPKVALNISLSATINNERITNVIGNECSIYTITIDNPFNDFLKTKKQLQEFSIVIRHLFDSIKARYNAQSPLHIFPAMPIATSVEFGRVWMPKADMPLIVFDENNAKNGFIKVLEINNAKP